MFWGKKVTVALLGCVIAQCNIGVVIGSTQQQQQKQKQDEDEHTAGGGAIITEADDDDVMKKTIEDDANSIIHNDNPRIPPSCTLVMAPSSIPNAGWGVFSLIDRRRGEAVLPGDVVIQVSDLNSTHAIGMKRIAFDYAWNAAETGGQYEGISVLSVIPGLGMLANGLPNIPPPPPAKKNSHHLLPNILPILEPAKGEAGCTRHSSPGAGAFTHYFNYTFHAQREIKAGGEIMANYGPNWFQQRQNLVVPGVGERQQQRQPKERLLLQRSSESLHESGYCLDNIKADDSTIPNAGRGAFASRDLSKDSIVAPVPVLPITNGKGGTMDVTRLRQVSKDKSVLSTTKQLLLNYCFSHPKSSVLLFPYSPLVNLINHSSKRSNVRLQWSSTSQQHESLTLEQLQQINTDSTSSAGGLLLELVATKNVGEGEELFLDYGNLWESAWNKHVELWEPYHKDYAPAWVMDEAVSVLGTQEEVQAQKPYPPNMITSCYYRFNTEDPAIKAQMEKNKDDGAARDFSTADWTHTPGIFELRNLRPCTVMQRFQVETTSPAKNIDNKEGDAEPIYYYTVVIRNRYGLMTEERIPVGHMHVVTRVPRRAIRFTDKIYTTDQHLTGAFRHEIGLANDIFPSQWMDLA